MNIETGEIRPVDQLTEKEKASGKWVPAETALPLALYQCGEHIAQFFQYAHLPPHLQAVSKPFAELAGVIAELPRNPERTVALRKLLEAKDAAVRAKLAQP